MAKLSREEVLKLAQLARLRLSDEEVEQYTKELSTIIDYFELLDKADIKGLEPTSQVTGLVNQFREDEIVVNQAASPDELLKRVPNTEGRYIKVKRMI